MYANEVNILGVPPTPITLTTADWQKFLGRDTASAGTIQMPYAGQIVQASDPIFGEVAFILAYGVAALTLGDTVAIGAGYATTRALAASRGIVGVAMAANTDPTALSWFAVRGQVPAKLLAASANLPAYTSATAGSLTNAVVATQQATGATILTALGATIGTKTVGTVNGSPQVTVGNIDGLYVGCAVSGTGIAGGATVTAIGYGGLMLGIASTPIGTLTLSANCTATAQVVGTFAHGAAFATVMLAHPVIAGLG